MVLSCSTSMERLLTPTAISPRRPTRSWPSSALLPLSHDVVTSLVGEGAAVLVRRALERAGLDPDTPDALERFLSHYDARLLDTTRPYPGMVETVRALGARHRLAVLTNKPQRPTMRILRGPRDGHAVQRCDRRGLDRTAASPTLPAFSISSRARESRRPRRSSWATRQSTWPPRDEPAPTSAWRATDSAIGSTGMGFEETSTSSTRPPSCRRSLGRLSDWATASCVTEARAHGQ